MAIEKNPKIPLLLCWIRDLFSWESAPYCTSTTVLLLQYEYFSTDKTNAWNAIILGNIESKIQLSLIKRETHSSQLNRNKGEMTIILNDSIAKIRGVYASISILTLHSSILLKANQNL
jgi:hypothetical protein